MMLKAILRRLGLLEPFDPHVVARAEVDNAIGDHLRKLERLALSSEALRQTQGRLREAVREVKSASDQVRRKNRDAIAGLVRDMRSSGRHTGGR